MINFQREICKKDSKTGFYDAWHNRLSLRIWTQQNNKDSEI